MTVRSRTASDLCLLLAALLLPRIAILLIAPEGLGSSDFRGWINVIVKLLEGENPYNTTAHLRWPPFWMQVLFVIGKLSLTTSISVIYLIKGLLISVECVLVICMFVCMKKLQIENARLLVVVGICLNPVAILQVVQHGNFDVVVGLWIFLFFFALSRHLDTGEESLWLLSALFLGLGIWTKTVPFALIPLMFMGLKTVSTAGKAVGAFLLLAPVTVAMSVVYVLGPEEVAEYVIRYRSAGGFFGLSGLLMIVGLEELASLMAYLFPVVLIGALAWLSVYLYRAESPSTVDSLRVALMILLAIPAFGPGYGPQYVYWFLPLLVVYFHFTSRRVRRFILVGHAVVVATYLFEYAFFRSHGAFVLLFDESDVVMDFCRAVGLQESQTLIRLPLFVVYLGVIGGIVASLKESRHG